MKNVIVVVCILIGNCFVENECATSIKLHATSQKYPGKCYEDVDPPIIFSPGETVQIPGRCTRATCGDDFSVHYASCGVVGVEPGCELLPGNLSLPYPDCCPFDFKCNKNV